MRSLLSSAIAATRRFPPVSMGRIAPAVFVCAMLALPGCSPPGPVSFRLNTEGRDLADFTPTKRQAIAATLEELFGTPDEPAVPPDAGPWANLLQLDLLRAAAGPLGVDPQRNPRGLYRQHCAACHGISGDGAGPTAAVQNPYPRDFRNGVFKFTSTAGGAKPLPDDLQQTVRRGIPGTAMPSFDKLPPEEIEALIEYVIYLSIRGETELLLRQVVVDEGDYPTGVEEVIEDCVAPVAGMWVDAAGKAIPKDVAQRSRPPVDTYRRLTASIDRGFELYSGKDAQCVECHGPNGRGDGEQSELYDDWNQPKNGATAEQTKKLAGRFRLPIQRLRARDFTEGVFLGGDRPIDLYWRIHVGIKGTPMPAAGPTQGSDGVLTPEEIWDVVHYVRRRAGNGSR